MLAVLVPLASPLAARAAASDQTPAGTARHASPARQAGAPAHLQFGPIQPTVLLAYSNADCISDGPGFLWLACWVIENVIDGVDWTRDHIIVPFLKETPLDTKNAAYPIWQAFRDLANVFFILIFMLVIFGTAVGFDNYTVKKVMPRLVAAALFIQISWAVSSFIVDIGNVLGQGIVALVDSIHLPKPQIDLTGGAFSTKSIFIGTALVGIGTAAISGAIGLSLSTVISLALALLAVFFTLAFRRILILLLAVFSSWAFLLWVLPNTEQYFKRWLSTMIRLSLMYPLIMLCFMGGRIFASVTNGAYTGSGKDDIAAPLFQLAGYIVPLLAVPATFNVAGRMMSVGVKGIGRVTSGLDRKYGNGSKFAQDRAERRKFKTATTAADPNAGHMRRAIARKRGGYGGFIKGSNVGTNIKGVGGIIGKATALNTAQKNRLYGNRDQALNEQAEVATSEAFNTKSSAELLQEKTRATEDKIMNVRIDEASISTQLADGTSLRDASMNADNKAELLQLARSSDAPTQIAAMRALGKSQAGQDELMKMRVSQFGGSNTDLVDPKHADTWAKGTRDIKTDDFRKPPAAAYSDTSSEEVAGMSSKRITRQMNYYNSEIASATAALNTATPGSAAHTQAQTRLDSATKLGQEFNTAVHGALTSPTLRDKVQPNTVQAIQDNLKQPYFDDRTRSEVSNRAAQIAPPAAQVVPAGIGQQLTASAAAANGGTADVGHLAAIHDELKTNTALRNTLEQKVLNNQPITVGDLPAQLQTPPPPAAITMPAAVQAKVVSSHQGNLNNIAAINAAYNDAKRSDYRNVVHQAVVNNRAVPLPPAE